MQTPPPEYIVMHHDDDCASHIGQTALGLQFFLTRPFLPTQDDTHLGCEFIALYLFDRDGFCVEARIDNLGPREYLNPSVADAAFAQRLSELGNVAYGSIRIRPFQMQHAHTVFGFVAHEPLHTDDEWYITVEPGNYMAFHAPWDSGDYDT
jgi:hypothetical protein